MSDTRVISRHPVDLLIEEHELLSSLLTAYEDLSPTQVREKTHLINRIEDEISRHVGTEEALFYPTILELKDPAVHERISEVLAEHRQMETMGGDLRRLQPGASRDLAVDVLKSLVERHISLEQREIFPQASKLERVTINQLGLEIEERRMREDRY
ncbi:MAG: hemerythrin domain-containing protein [Planctomycetaceae bacterium]|nr:hemerythrin domain-containing protein [Planctomycetaceae bacterium]